MVRALFKNMVIATAGALPAPFTDENITRWAGLRKGTFSAELDEYVTHLLCTPELLEKRGPRGMYLFLLHPMPIVLHSLTFLFQLPLGKSPSFPRK